MHRRPRTIVPNTATIDTAVQYGQVRYRGVRNCQVIATANTTNPASTPRYWLTSCTRQSDTASPIAVVSSFTDPEVRLYRGNLRSAARNVRIHPLDPGAVLP